MTYAKLKDEIMKNMHAYDFDNADIAEFYEEYAKDRKR